METIQDIRNRFKETYFTLKDANCRLVLEYVECSELRIIEDVYDKYRYCNG